MADAAPRSDEQAAPSAGGGDPSRTKARYGIGATAGALGAASAASLCCIGPLLFVTFGVGAGLASTFEPLRPFFTVLTIGFLALGFYVVYGRRRTAGVVCASDGSCAVPRARRRDVLLLWTATLLAIVLLTFPRWSNLLV